MKKAFVVILGVALLCFLVTDADAVKNANGKWALHYAGPHSTKNNTCDYEVLDCHTDIDVVGSSTIEQQYDVYVIAIDVVGIAGAMYGLCCDGDFYFYGWTNCAELEIPTEDWPGCGEGTAQTWSAEQPGPHVTLGILDVYTYASSACLSTCVHPTELIAQWCDGSPLPVCFETDGSVPAYFGKVGWNGSGCGYNPCNIVPTEQRSWGAVKSLYR